MSAALFYILAALLVLAATAVVLAPTARQVGISIVAVDVLVGILLVASGAYLLGAAAIAAPSACLLALAVLLRRAGYEGLVDAVPGRVTAWPAAAAVSAAIGALLLWTATRVEDVAGSSPPGQGLLTVLHHRTEVAVGVSVVLAAVAVGGALMIGRVGDDERLLDRAAEQRRLREQRNLMRRQHRAAARAQRGGGAPP